MSLQKTNGVAFDPSIIEHRNAVKSYLKRNAWRDADICFAHDPKFNSLVEQVRTKMLNWYISQEDVK